MVARPEGAQACPKCSGTMGGDGVCLACGFSEMATPALLPEMDMHEPGKECPRCYAPLEAGSKFCSICGGDVEKLAKKQKQKEERVTVMKEDAKPGAKIDVGKAKAPPPLGAAQPKPEPAPPPIQSLKAPEPPKAPPVPTPKKAEPAKATPVAVGPGAWPVRGQPPIPTPPKTEPAKPEPPKAPPIPQPRTERAKLEPLRAPPIPQPRPTIMPGPPQQTPPRPVTPSPIKENVCEKCKKPLKLIEKYDRWYCNDCKAYAPKEKPRPAEAHAPSEKRTRLTMDEVTIISHADAKPPVAHAPKEGPATPPPAIAPIHTVPPSPSDKHCKTCNSPIPAGAKWCDVCGEKT